MQTNTLANPVDTFLGWYDGLNVEQKLRISVDLIYTDPLFGQRFHAGQHDSDMEAPAVFLRQEAANAWEILGRIGTLKILVDVQLCAPSGSSHVGARDQASATIQIITSDPKTHQEDIDAAREAYKFAGTMVDRNEDMYLSWGELTTPSPGDASGSGSPLSSIYLYRWLCLEQGKPDPFDGV